MANPVRALAALFAKARTAFSKPTAPQPDTKTEPLALTAQQMKLLKQALMGTGRLVVVASPETTTATPAPAQPAPDAQSKTQATRTSVTGAL